MSVDLHGETKLTDAQLLRRHEPVIRFTKGEYFFPTDVAAYVAESSLWVQRPNQLARRLWPEGELTLARLAEPRAHGFGAVYYLKFIEPLNLATMAAMRVRQGLGRGEEEQFVAGPGRLARVGYSSRLVDALFSLSLLARGRVPGDTAAAAVQAYDLMRAGGAPYRYYGRVVRRDGWTVLQYWFFYAYNNWRSGFFGANDHEADWEMVSLYLYESEQGDLRPEWVAYASHDFSGDDLRRNWHDPELEKEGEHPVVYAGAGSHASYFRAGEYLTELELPFVTPALDILDRFQGFYERYLLGYQPGRRRTRWSELSIFRVPFVDYARGDGLVVGPGSENPWAAPEVIDPPPPWVAGYRGLWGLFANDPFSGEDAPAGPMYNRDGSVRRAWYDPLGWAGLDKVPPPPEKIPEIDGRRAAIASQIDERAARIEGLSRDVRDLGVDLAAISGRPHMQPLADAKRAALTDTGAELAALRAAQTEARALDEALRLYRRRLADGDSEPLRAHIGRAHLPADEEGETINRLAEAWAAISIGLMMVGFVVLLLFARQFLFVGLTAMVALIVFIEASFRRRIARLIASLTVALTIVATLLLVFEFFWYIVIFAVLLSGAYIIVENVRELR